MILIGISGVTSSGKTTLLNNLSNHYGSEIGTLSFDDYFIGSDIQDVDTIEDFETPDLYNFDAFLNDLRRAKAGESVTFRANSRESVDAGIKEKILSSTSALIVEGWLLFHDPRVTELFDGKIYIDISEELLTKRRYQRTRGKKHWDSLEYINEKIIPAFHRYVKPQSAHADLVINAEQDEKSILHQAIDFIDNIAAKSS